MQWSEGTRFLLHGLETDQPVQHSIAGDNGIYWEDIPIRRGHQDQPGFTYNTHNEDAWRP